MTKTICNAAKQSSRETFENFKIDGTWQRRRASVLPLFVFLSRQFERPLVRHEERFSYALDSCQRLPRKRSDTERELARFSDRETNHGHEACTMNKNILDNVATAKNKIVALWKSGIKGRIIIIIVSIIIIKLVDTSLRTKTSQGDTDTTEQSSVSSLAKSAKEFFRDAIKEEGKYWIESNEEEPEEYDHLPYMKVKPNVLTLPKYFSRVGTPFHYCESGNIYPFGGYKVDFTGDDYVIVKGFSSDEFAYINTKHEYTDGSLLKSGLYECVGRKKMPLTNGSHVTMFAFNQLPDDLYSYYQRIIAHNEKVEQATFRENDRRESLAKGEKIKILRKKIAVALKDELENFNAEEIRREFENRIHIAPNIRDKVKLICELRFSEPFVREGKNGILDASSMTYEEVKKVIEEDGAVDLIEKRYHGDLTLIVRDSSIKNWAHKFFVDYKPPESGFTRFTGVERSFTVITDKPGRGFIRYHVRPDSFDGRQFVELSANNGESGRLLTGEHVFLLPSYGDLKKIKSSDSHIDNLSAFLSAYEKYRLKAK